MIKQFVIFKVKKGEKSPDYRISINNNGKWTDIGAGWIKEGKKGKFISCQLSNGYKDLAGYKIVPDSGLTEEEKEKIAAARAGEEAKKAAAKDVDPNEIDF